MIFNRDYRMIMKEGRRILKGNMSETFDQYQPKDKVLTWILVVAGVLVMVALFAGCACAQELTASWYSVESLKKEGTWAYSHGRMANGHIFKDEGLTCATRLFKIGTTLQVVSIRTGKRIRVQVTDRIGKRFAKNRIDLSKKAFEKIANLKQGLIKVNVEAI